MGSDEQLDGQAELFSETWSQAYRTILANRESAIAQLPHVTLEQLDEVVSTVGRLLRQTSVPKAFAPVFHLAHGFIVTMLPSALQTMTDIVGGDFSHLPTLVGQLNQMCAGLHLMLVFGKKGETRDAIANLGVQLSEALSLLDTAQSELETKHRTLQAADEALKKVEESRDAIAAICKNVADHEANVAESLVKANADCETTRKLSEAAQSDRDKLADLVKQNTDLQQALAEQKTELKLISSELLAQQATIKELLPAGASAGLAYAFALRVSQLNVPKRVWASIFVFAIVLLVGAGIYVTVGGTRPVTVGVNQTLDPPLWTRLVMNLPIIAPLVWLGWFSARQYGNTIRVQEDYAFKEATSKAFAGYRDHMEHLNQISGPDGKNAMTMLSVRTIEILSREPLRVFGRIDSDAAPSSAAMDFVKRDNPPQG